MRPSGSDCTIEKTGASTARKSTRSGACSSSGSSGCWSDGRAANISTGSPGSGSRRTASQISARLERYPRPRYRVAHRGRARPRAGRCLLRPSRRRRFPVDLLHPSPRPARLPAGARRLPRHLRPRAAADEPGFADYMQAYGEGGLKALRLGHCSAGPPLLVHGRVRPDRARRRGCASTAPASCRPPGEIGLLPRRSASAPAALRPAADHAHAATASTLSSRPISSSTISSSCSRRRGRTSHRSIARSPVCPISRPMRCHGRDPAPPTASWAKKWAAP